MAPGLWKNTALAHEQSALAETERAAEHVESASSPAEVITAGQALALAHQHLRRYVDNTSPAGKLRQTTQELFHAATIAWISKSQQPHVRTAVLRTLDPDADNNSTRLCAVGVHASDPEAPLLQLVASLSPARLDPEGIWSPNHHVLLVTDRAAYELSSSGPYSRRLHPTDPEVALVPSERVAETAAALWDPNTPEATYTRLLDAVDAAKALTGEQSVASREIAAWVTKHRKNAGEIAGQQDTHRAVKVNARNDRTGHDPSRARAKNSDCHAPHP